LCGKPREGVEMLFFRRPEKFRFLESRQPCRIG